MKEREIKKDIGKGDYWWDHSDAMKRDSHVTIEACARLVYFDSLVVLSAGNSVFRPTKHSVLLENG